MPTPIRLVIFDLDGTLINAYPAIYRSFNYTIKQAGYAPQPEGVIRRAVGWGDANLLKPFVKPGDLERCLSVYRRHHRKSLVRYSRLIPQALRVLKFFKRRGCLLAVASNRPTAFSHILIRHLGLKEYFNMVLCADKLAQGKPHPQILKEIMRGLAVAPAQTLYVGDMQIDGQAGKRAHVRTILVEGGSSTRQELAREKPWRIIKKIGLLTSAAIPLTPPESGL
jgi:phosphoglycolate phosphatase